MALIGILMCLHNGLNRGCANGQSASHGQRLRFVSRGLLGAMSGGLDCRPTGDSSSESEERQLYDSRRIQFFT
jgi:hypothetical protein